MTKDQVMKIKPMDYSFQTNMVKLVKFGHFFIGGGPTPQSFSDLKRLGINKVINIRTPAESLPNEKELAQSAGLIYVNIPVPGCHALTETMVQKVNSEINPSEDGTTLIYCASGNRASSWLAFYLFDTHGLTAEESISVSKTVALTKPDITQETYDLLLKRQKN